MTEISFAKPSDELALKRLFLNCFDDTLGFVNMFFDAYFSEKTVLVAKQNGTASGLLFMLPCQTDNAPCFYIYGFCVEQSRRGQGIGKALLLFADERAKKQGGRIILHPESEELFAFYEKLGLQPAAFIKEAYIFPSEESAVLYPISATEYKERRDFAFKHENPVLWSTAAVEYALLQETFFGGTSYRFECDGKSGILLCGRTNGEPFIKETDVSEELLPRVCAAVTKKLGGDRVKVWLPNSATTGKRKTIGYGSGFSTPVYLNLLLD